MTDMNIIQAVNSALDIALSENEDVVLFGEDIGRFGGVFRATDGLQAKHGEERVFDTPLSEAGIIGTAIGMALYGMTPVPEIQFSDFIYPAFDQIVNELAKFRYRSGGQYPCPVTVRTPYGGGIRGGHYHSQSPEAYFAHTPGLKVVVPSDPYTAKGLLLASIDDPDPVLFLEPKRVYRASRADVPDEAYRLPLGQAVVDREGDHVTVVAYGAVLHEARRACDLLAENDISAELVDLRSLVPLDEETLLNSVRKTGRLVIVHEAPRTCGFGAELAALVAEKALLHLEAPILRVTGYDTPFPYTLEMQYLPDALKIFEACETVVDF
ncbi:MAG: alpha-ketoacid dehydrogenase subunit beta [Deltaproteobacteria bacterium]|nr:alpha-ketoacid dehydrogenase subunit beta [Deltaproteobacteria bacterium]